MNVLLIDNNDSFTINLEHLLISAAPGSVVTVVSHALLAEADLAGCDLVVISPGPGEPSEYPGYGRVLDVGRPVLGVCLGMQILNEHCGGRTGRLAGCVHGKTDRIALGGRRRTVARYHSLHASEVGDGLEVLARNADGVVMCLGNRDARLLGYQFHPESFLTPDGGWFIGFALDYLHCG